MPHTQPQPGGHCPTVSAWLMRTDGPEPRVLVHLHKRYGMLLQPGGHVEGDEHAWSAVLREVREEAGYEPGDLSVLQPYEVPDPGVATSVVTPVPLLQDCHLVEPDVPIRHWDSVFAFVVAGEPPLAPAEGESRDLRWLTVAELAATGLAPADAVAKARFATSVVDAWLRLPAAGFPTRGAADA